jgi:predicted metal-dependent hydrolase
MDNQLQTGVRLFNKGEFFECHEVLEAAWTAEHGPRRLFLQSLIHIAVGFYHCQRGNREGTIRQLNKGLRKLDAYLPSYEGLDTAQLHRDVRAALEHIESDARAARGPQIRMHTLSGSRCGMDI